MPEVRQQGAGRGRIPLAVTLSAPHPAPPALHCTPPQPEMGRGTEGSTGYVQSQKQWKADEDQKGLGAERKTLVVLLSETGNG